MLNERELLEQLRTKNPRVFSKVKYPLTDASLRVLKTLSGARALLIQHPHPARLFRISEDLKLTLWTRLQKVSA